MSSEEKSYSLSFIKDNAMVIAGQALIFMKGILLMPLIIKSLGTNTYGAFTLLSSILGVALGISSFGTGYRMHRFLPAVENRAKRQLLFFPQFFFQFFSILLLSCVLLILDDKIRILFLDTDISYSSFLMPLYLFSFFLYSQGSDYFRYTSRIHVMTIATIALPYVHLSLILVYYYFFKSISINVIFISLAATTLSIALPCFWIIFKEIRFKVVLYSLKEMISDIKLGLPLVFVFLVDFVLSGSDRYFIAYYLNVKDLGAYVPAYTLGTLFVFIPRAMGTTLPQLLSKAVDLKHEANARSIVNYSVKTYLLIAIPYIFGCFVFGREILTILANVEIAQKSLWVTPFVALGALFLGLNSILSNIFFVNMRTDYLFKMNVFAAVFNLVANAIFLFFYRDIIVAAITTFLSYFLVFCHIKKVLRTEGWKVDFCLGFCLKSFIASLTMALVLTLTKSFEGSNFSSLALVAMIFAGCFIYALTLFFLGAFSEKEMKFIRNRFF